MDENPGLSDQYRKASPWPIFIALGLPVSEIGLVFDIFPLAVGGLLLFCGCIAGILLESNYAETLWGPVLTMIAILVAFGAALLVADGYTEIGLVTRAYAVFASAIIMSAGLVAGKLFVPKQQASV
ncbi:cox cluster protein [Halorubraceae archaeon YAN]|nr:cox cluster protein [Halorubraceae archaeon YAN]